MLINSVKYISVLEKIENLQVPLADLTWIA
jgi:hypothetical protein